MPDKKPPINDFARYSSLGLQMALFIAACALAGIYLDKQDWFRFPVFTIFGAIFGVFGAMYYMLKQIK